MSLMHIACLELITVGGLGVILILSGVIGNLVKQRQIQSCTKQTSGVVRKYHFQGDGKMHPVVEYFVDGTCYQTKKTFCGFKIKRISGFPMQIESNAYEDEKGWLHVKIGPVVNLHYLAEQLWPIGSKMTVYYNPNNPKKCYVERPILKSFAFTMFIITGTVTLLLGVLLFFIMQI